MSLSKRDRQELINNLAEDMQDWDAKDLIRMAVDNQMKYWESLSNDKLIDTYCETLNIEKCDHCGHVSETGACFYCKMD